MPYSTQRGVLKKTDGSGSECYRVLVQQAVPVMVQQAKTNGASLCFVT